MQCKQNKQPALAGRPAAADLPKAVRRFFSSCVALQRPERHRELLQMESWKGLLALTVSWRIVCATSGSSILRPSRKTYNSSTISCYSIV